MADNSNNGAWLAAGLGIGVILGGLFIWAILRSREAVPQSTVSMQSFPMQSIPAVQPAIPRPSSLMPVNMYPVIREDAVNIQAPELPRVIDLLGVQGPVSSPEPAVPGAETTMTTYKNNERWEIERGEDGHIKSLNVIRDAKVNASS